MVYSRGLTISYCNLLTDLTGLGAYTNSTYSFSIEHCNGLVSLYGVALRSIHRGLNINYNNDLASVAGLDSLVRVDGPVRFQANAIENLDPLDSQVSRSTRRPIRSPADTLRY